MGSVWRSMVSGIALCVVLGEVALGAAGEGGRGKDPSSSDEQVARLEYVGMARPRAPNVAPLVTFRVLLSGRLLGRWRLHVDSLHTIQTAYASGKRDGLRAPEDLEFCWRQSVSNDFNVDVALVDNTLWNNVGKQEQAFSLPVGEGVRLKAVLEYRPALDEEHPEQTVIAVVHFDCGAQTKGRRP